MMITVVLIKTYKQIHWIEVPRLATKDHGSLPHHFARTLTARRICLGHCKTSVLI